MPPPEGQFRGLMAVFDPSHDLGKGATMHGVCSGFSAALGSLSTQFAPYIAHQFASTLVASALQRWSGGLRLDKGTVQLIAGELFLQRAIGKEARATGIGLRTLWLSHPISHGIGDEHSELGGALLWRRARIGFVRGGALVAPEAREALQQRITASRAAR